MKASFILVKGRLEEGTNTTRGHHSHLWWTESFHDIYVNIRSQTYDMWSESIWMFSFFLKIGKKSTLIRQKRNDWSCINQTPPKGDTLSGKMASARTP
jgi:hypothetical protein